MAARISSAIPLNDRGKPDQSQGRKATGPRFLREATDDSPKGLKIAGLPAFARLRFNQAKKGEEMKKPLISLICASLILSAAAQADGITLNQRYSGNGLPTMIDTNGDGVTAAHGNFYVRGAPGRATVDSFNEFTNFMPYFVDDCDLRAGLVAQTYVETFEDGSMLFYQATEGFLCLNFSTFVISSEIRGVITGGTGRYAGASGTWVNVGKGFSAGVGMNVFEGTLKGNIVVPK
jgi:hypothetical protein